MKKKYALLAVSLVCLAGCTGNSRSSSVQSSESKKTAQASKPVTKKSSKKSGSKKPSPFPSALPQSTEEASSEKKAEKKDRIQSLKSSGETKAKQILKIIEEGNLTASEKYSIIDEYGDYREDHPVSSSMSDAWKAVREAFMNSPEVEGHYQLKIIDIDSYEASKNMKALEDNLSTVERDLAIAQEARSQSR